MTTRDLTVVFDLGAVLIDWNPRYLYRQLFDGDETAMEHFLAEICSPAWNSRFDEGHPFATGVAELSEKHPEHGHLIQAYYTHWIDMIGGPIAGTVELFDELHDRGVPLYALTNWSAETLPLLRGHPDYRFLDDFRDIFVSGTLRMAKPDPAIFRHALARIGKPAGGCLFIDDNAANIASAQRMGFHVHVFTTPEELATDLRERGLIG